MNNPPDDTTLALWLDDELEGEEHARIEAWAADHPEQLAAREEIRRWRRMISDCVPAVVEPPAGEFFNERVQHAIRGSAVTQAAPSRSRHGWRSWSSAWLPVAACAGMVLAFWLGALLQPKDPLAGRSPGNESPRPHLYTPEQGVDAHWISNHHASATVIVLSGVQAIPDDIDFATTASHSSWREINSTASTEAEHDNE